MVSYCSVGPGPLKPWTLIHIPELLWSCSSHPCLFHHFLSGHNLLCTASRTNREVRGEGHGRHNSGAGFFGDPGAYGLIALQALRDAGIKILPQTFARVLPHFLTDETFVSNK